MSFPQDQLPPMLPEEEMLAGDPGMEVEPSPLESLEDAPIPELPEVEAPDYTVHLDPHRLQQLGQRVVDEVQHWDMMAESRRANADQWRRAARMMPDDNPGPHPMAAASQAADTRRCCQAHSVRLNTQILRADPPFTGEPGDAQAAAWAPLIEEIVKDDLEAADWLTIGRELHDELPVVSPALLRVAWRREVQRFPTYHTDYNQQAVAALASADVPFPIAARAGFSLNDEGRLKTTFTFAERVVHESTELVVVPFEDMVLLPGTAKRTSDLWGIGERVTIRGMDLTAGVDRNPPTYLEQSVRRLLGMPSDPMTEERAERLDLSDVEDAGPSARDEAPYREYDCVEIAWRDDLNRDGAMEWYLLTVHLQTGIVLRCQYSPYWHGRPPYVLFPYNRKVGSLYGESIAELVAVLQEVQTALTNSFIDLAEMLVGAKGSFIFDEQSGFDPSTFTLEAGRPIGPVRDASRIKEIPIGTGIPQALAAIQAFLSWNKDQIDLLTAASNPALGKETDTQKTLGEVQIAVGQSAQIFEDYATGVALCWAEVAEMVRFNRAQFAPGGVVTIKRPALPGRSTEDPETGEEVPVAMVAGQMAPAPNGLFEQQIPATVLLANVRMKPAGLSVFSDRQSRIQRSLLAQQMSIEHPLLAQSPDAQLLILSRTLQDLDHPDREKVMASVEQALAAMQQAQALMAGMQMQQQASAEEQMTQDRALQQQQAGQQQAQGEQQMRLAEAEAARAQDQHAMQQAQGVTAMAGQFHLMRQPPANGKGKK